jgi:hypothetical protein
MRADNFGVDSPPSSNIGLHCCWLTVMETPLCSCAARHRRRCCHDSAIIKRSSAMTTSCCDTCMLTRAGKFGGLVQASCLRAEHPRMLAYCIINFDGTETLGQFCGTAHRIVHCLSGDRANSREMRPLKRCETGAIPGGDERSATITMQIRNFPVQACVGIITHLSGVCFSPWIHGIPKTGTAFFLSEHAGGFVRFG